MFYLLPATLKSQIKYRDYLHIINWHLVYVVEGIMLQTNTQTRN